MGLTSNGTPTATLPITNYKIYCGNGEYGGISEGTISLETKGLDWVKNLSGTGSGLDSAISALAIFNPKEIYFFGWFTNNSTNIAADFGQTVTKRSYPIAGTDSSSIIVKLNENGGLLSTRVLGGNDFNRVALDTAGNQYLLSTFKISSVTSNPDPEFNGGAVIKTGSAPVGDDNFLLNRVNYDGSFGFSRTINATTESRGKSLCYSKTNNRLYIGGIASGTGDLGSDFGTMDAFATNTGFILEITLDGGYIRSRRFSGTTHQVDELSCQTDGGYSFATYQTANTLDYRITYDGMSDLKGPNNQGTGLTRIASGDVYQFTKIFPPSASSLQPMGFDTDSDGNMVIGFQGSSPTAEIRSGVDGIGDTKTSAGGIEIYIVKVSKSGAYLWGKRIGGTLSDVLFSIQIRPSNGNVFVLGAFGQSGASSSQTLFSDLGSVLSLTPLSSNGNPFLVELEKDTGAFVRHIPLGSSSSGGPFLTSMKFDSEENLYLGGTFSGNSTFQYSSSGKSISKSFTFGNSQQGVFMKIRP
jgi:hypothetical protein